MISRSTQNMIGKMTGRRLEIKSQAIRIRRSHPFNEINKNLENSKEKLSKVVQIALQW